MLIRSMMGAAALSLAACTTVQPVAPSLAPQDGASAASAAASGRPVKVMIVTMFAPEGQAWLDRLGPWQAVAVPGLSPDYPAVRCNRHDVCVVTTGMGYANAAASTMALTFSTQFDLRRTYFLISGIAGVDPAQGTLGSAAWATYLVDFSLQWELDARERPAGWPTGYLGINTKRPDERRQFAELRGAGRVRSGDREPVPGGQPAGAGDRHALGRVARRRATALSAYWGPMQGGRPQLAP